jgi:hypothetical protein
MAKLPYYIHHEVGATNTNIYFQAYLTAKKIKHMNDMPVTFCGIGGKYGTITAINKDGVIEKGKPYGRKKEKEGTGYPQHSQKK